MSSEGSQMGETSEGNKNEIVTSSSAVYFKNIADEPMLMRQAKPAGKRTSEVRANRVQPEVDQVIIEIRDKDSKPASPPAPPLDDKLSNGLPKSPSTDNSKDKNAVEMNHPIHRKRNIMEKLKSSTEASGAKQNSEGKIERVPRVLRKNEDFKMYYKPKVVSIGPYHHKKETVEGNEELKLKFTKIFIEKHELNADELYSKVEEKIKKLKEYYEEEVIKKFKDDELVWMFFVDGCTILCYIDCATRSYEESMADLKIKIDCLTLLKQDLLLLENQLPYKVLKLIMSCLKDKGDAMRKAIDKFIFERIKAPEEKYVEKKQVEIGSPTHLLDLLRTRLLEPVTVTEDDKTCSNLRQLRKKVGKFLSEPVEKIQDLVEYVGKAFEEPPPKPSQDSQAGASKDSEAETPDLHFFRNVEELNSVGIRLKASDTSRLNDITFNLGTLKLPPIRVDESTASKFLNLIAYEMCPNFVNNFGVCSYIVFLDAFIDRAQDVKQLRDKQILHNALGSDDAVARLFNVISTNLVPDPKKYSDIKSSIQRRYENKPVTWIAQFHHQHFRSPWSVLAFLAAIIALASTIVQTTYAILSYNRS